MKQFLNIFLAVACLAGFAACSEVKELDEYDNWEERNQAYVDSLINIASGRVVITASEANAMQVGTMYAIETSASTNKLNQYVYVKKLLANEVGRRPFYTDKVSVYYYGTYLNGKSFDGNFKGYTGVDKGELDGTQRLPDQFDSPTEFAVSNLIVGWKTALQYMREGERWMVYIPYQSGYGKDGSSSVLGYSMLCFDIILDEVEKDE